MMLPAGPYAERISYRLTGMGAKKNVPLKKCNIFEINLFVSKKKICETLQVFTIDYPFNSHCGKRIFSFNSFMTEVSIL